MAEFIYDASFGHAQMTPAALKPTGSIGVILYAGCADSRKNTTGDEVRALLDAGFQVGLVIENFATDAIGGASVGDAQGSAILAAAKDLGYAAGSCVLFGGYDTDSHEADWPKLLAYMEAFAKHVPVPGFYGDSDAIDFIHARHPDWIFWQSDSRSFSPLNPTPNAHLLQLFNDSRAHGLPVDVDLVERPLPLMGADLALTTDDIQKVAHASALDLLDACDINSVSIRNVLRNLVAAADGLAKQVTALKAEVDGLSATAPAVTGAVLHVAGDLTLSQ